MRTFRSSALVVAWLLLSASILSACSVSLRSKAVKSAQAAHLSVGAAQDAEIQLFAAGAIPGMTMGDHQRFHAALVKYYDAEAKVLTVLQAWRAGDPAPANLSEALAALSEATKVLQAVGPERLASSLAYIAAAVEALNQVLALTRGEL